MKLGLKHIGLSLGVLSLVATAGYVGSNYVDGNYVQGTYTSSGGRPVDAAPAPDAATTTMSVAIADSADPVITGADAYSYTVTLTNTGAVDATTVSVATTLDSSLTYVSSSGTGWACSRSLQVVTCTRATAAPGAQPGITINVTTGSSAVSATSSVLASAANASHATAAQVTTVQLVSKDALAGIYLPASSTEWSAFIARKALTGIAVPDAIWLLQEASGNAADSSGNGFTLTASGTGLAYQQSVAGWSRKAITFTDGGTGVLKSTSASLPDISTTSQFTVVLANVATPAAQRQVLAHGTTLDQLAVTINPLMRVRSASNQADGIGIPTGAVKPWALRTNRTAGTCTGFTDADKASPTFGTTVTGKQIAIGAASSTCPTMSALYAFEWHGANAEISDANYKALLQAMGLAITF